jgi:peptide/nickel transport system substrate-binding protein
MRRPAHNAPLAPRRHSITRRRFLEILGAGSGAVLVARCAPAPQPEPTSAPVPTTPPAPGATPTPVPPTPTAVPTLEPEVLIYSSFVEVSTIDPRDKSDMLIDCMVRALYDGFWWKEGWPPKLSPLLCESFEVSDDLMEWTFHLVDNALFHDGTPVTAYAAEWSLQSLLRLQKERASALTPYMGENSVEAVDDHTLRIVLTSPFADLPWVLVDQFQAVLNHEEVLRHEVDGDEGQGWLIDNEAGSGPFVIKRWEPGSLYELEAVPDYWRGWPDDGRLAGVIYTITRDAAERRMALIAGQVDAIDTLAPDDLPLIDDNPGTHTEVYSSLLGVYIMMNNQREPFTDPNFRKFVAHAFDYEGFVTTQGGPQLAPLMTGCLPEGVPGHDPSIQPIYRQDLDKAQEYLDKTPWAEGGLELDFVYVTQVAWEEAMGTMLAEPLGQFGIKVNLVPTAWPDLVAMTAYPDTAGDFTAIVSALGPVATQWFRFQYYSPVWDNPDGAGYNSATFYKNPDFDAILEEAESTADEENRLALVAQMQQMIMEDAPAVMVHTLPNLYGFSDRVKGFDYVGHIAADWYPMHLEEA